MPNIKTPEAIFFCHGAPGSEQDSDLLSGFDKDLKLLAPNLFAGQTKSDDPISRALAQFDEMTSAFSDGKVQVVGFSIGAMVAIEIAAARPARVGRLTLISPAAPLDLGNFLEHMAGKPVFELAIKKPKLLRALTFIQGILVQVCPNFLIAQLFSKCGEVEKSLLSDPAFKKTLLAGMLNSFCKFPNAYVSLIRQYVGDWSGQIVKVLCPVTIWHGEKDTWSPITMPYALCKNIAGTSKLHIVPGAEHYSTLTKVEIRRISK